MHMARKTKQIEVYSKGVGSLTHTEVSVEGLVSALLSLTRYIA